MSRRPHRALLTLAVVAVAAACGGDDDIAPPPVDGGVDGGVAPIPWIERGIPPLEMTPCAVGFHEMIDGEGVATCHPYPEGGPLECPRGQAHFPGDTGCSAIGTPCPAGDYSDDVPAAGAVVYVNASAPPGGDGSRASPHASLSEVNWLGLAPGTTVALARGTYAGSLPLEASIRVVGACAAETILSGVDGPVQSVVALPTAGEPPVVQNLAIVDAPQPAVVVASGRSLVLDGVLIDRASGTGLIVTEASSTLVLRDVVVRGTRPDSARTGRGINVSAGGRVEGARVIVESNEEIGVFVNGEGASMTLDGSVVRGTLPNASGASGRGVAVQSGALFEATGLFVSQNHEVGLSVTGDGALARLVDTVVEDTSPLADGEGGGGLSVQLGRLEATRLVVSRTVENAIYVAEPGTTAVLSDVVVRDTAVRDRDGVLGRPLVVQYGAMLEGTRMYFVRNASTGLMAARDAHVSITDVAIRDTTTHRDLLFGYGVTVQTHAQLSGERLLVDGAFEIGLASHAGASVDLRGVAVRRVAQSACDCPDRIYGYGISAIGASMRLEDIDVADTATCGLFVSRFTDALGSAMFPDPPSLDVESGVVQRSPIGACVQVDGYDITRLMRGVRYQDNGTNLEATTLPVPEFSEAL